MSMKSRPIYREWTPTIFRERRKELGLSSARLAKMIGVKTRIIRRWGADVNPPQIVCMILGEMKRRRKRPTLPRV